MRQGSVDEVGEDGFDDCVQAVVISASGAGSGVSVTNERVIPPDREQGVV
jgi:hypothetical protein